MHPECMSLTLSVSCSPCSCLQAKWGGRTLTRTSMWERQWCGRGRTPTPETSSTKWRATSFAWTTECPTPDMTSELDLRDPPVSRGYSNFTLVPSCQGWGIVLMALCQHNTRLSQAFVWKPWSGRQDVFIILQTIWHIPKGPYSPISKQHHHHQKKPSKKRFLSQKAWLHREHRGHSLPGSSVYLALC